MSASNKKLGRNSERGNALLLDLRDQAKKLFNEANIDPEKSAQIANGTKWVENIDGVLDDYESKLISALPKANP